MVFARTFLVFLLSAFCASCFSPELSIQSCEFRCQQGCPEGLLCQAGFCVEPDFGGQCLLTSADAGSASSGSKPRQPAAEQLADSGARLTVEDPAKMRMPVNSGALDAGNIPVLGPDGESSTDGFVVVTDPLPKLCPGVFYRTQLRSQGGGGNAIWRKTLGPDWLSVDESGLVEGTPPLHAFVGVEPTELGVRAFSGDNSVASASFELEDSRCQFVFIASAAGVRSLHLANASTTTTKELSAAMPAGYSVESFKWAPSGNQLVFLAFPDEPGLSGHPRLLYFASLLSQSVVLLALPGVSVGEVGSSSVVDYAWGSTDEQFAYVTKKPSRALSSLGLVDLTTDPGTLSNEQSVSHESRLEWLGSRLCYAGPFVPGKSDILRCVEVSATAEIGGTEQELPVILTPEDFAVAPIYKHADSLFVLSAARGVTGPDDQVGAGPWRYNVSFAAFLTDSPADPTVGYLNGAALLSSTGRFLSQPPDELSGNPLRLFPSDELLFIADPSFEVPACDALHAWAAGVERAACLMGNQIGILDFPQGAAAATIQRIGGEYPYGAGTFRRTFSPSGRFYAYDWNGETYLVDLEKPTPAPRLVGRGQPSPGVATTTLHFNSKEYLLNQFDSSLARMDPKLDQALLLPVSESVRLDSPLGCGADPLAHTFDEWCGGHDQARHFITSTDGQSIVQRDGDATLWVYREHEMSAAKQIPDLNVRCLDGYDVSLCAQGQLSACMLPGCRFELMFQP